MGSWTSERVSQLAPDAASAAAGRGLASARHWATLGRDSGEDSGLWGECQGSGAKPYQVRIDLAEPAFKCSCPSRKFPCKHALGLMLMHVAGAVAVGPRPAWVEEWFTSRATREEKRRERAEAPPTPVDAAAQERRRADRLDRIGDGLAALRLWLDDLARSGIAGVPSRDHAFFDAPARRLIDAQAPGAARRVHALAGVASSGVGWQRTFLEQAALLHLMVRGFERRDVLPEATRETLMNAIGVPRTQEEVLAQPAIADRWQVIGQELTSEDRLRAQRSWLIGERTGRHVLILAFAHGAEPLDATLSPGLAFDGEVCLYPGSGIRGLVKSKGASLPFERPAHGGDVDALLARYAAVRAVDPWVESVAGVLGDVVPRRADTGIDVLDGSRRPLRLAGDEAAGWRMLALSGGRPIDVVVRFDGHSARPLGCFVGGDCVRLDEPPGAEAA